MLLFSILRLCLLVANFIAYMYYNTAYNLFKEFELKSGPTKNFGLDLNLNRLKLKLMLICCCCCCC